MIERGNGARLTLEPLPDLGTVGRTFRQDFDGDRPMQAGVNGAVHLAHASSADRGEDLVRAQTSPSG